MNNWLGQVNINSGGGGGGGEGPPILDSGREFPRDLPPFLHFPDPIGSFFMLMLILLTPSFCRKNWFVSITFSSRSNLT